MWPFWRIGVAFTAHRRCVYGAGSGKREAGSGKREAGQRGSGAAGQRGSGAAGQRGSGAAGGSTPIIVTSR